MAMTARLNAISRAISRLQQLIQRQGNRCALCTWPFREDDPATVDHIVPRSAGGSNALTNLQAAHWTCNNRRGNMSIQEWRIRVKELTGEGALAKSHHVCPLSNTELLHRIETLMRANAKLSEDWNRMREEIDAVRKVLGSDAYREGGIVEAVKKLKTKKPEECPCLSQQQ